MKFGTFVGYSFHYQNNLNCSAENLSAQFEKYEKALIARWESALAKKLTFIHCKNCGEVVMSKQCSKCSKDKLMFSKENDALPREIPPIMENISHYLASAIARINTVTPIVDRKNTFKGRVINFKIYSF